MKRILSVLLIFVLCFPLGACRHIPVPSPRNERTGVEIVTPKPATKTTPKPTAQPTSTPQPTPEPKPEIEIISEQLVLHTDGDTYVYLCEFVNPCKYAIELDASIDIEDAEGNLLSVEEYVSTSPSVIPIGGRGFICTTVVNATYDTDVDITAVAKAVLHYDIEKAMSNRPPVEVISVSLGTKYGFPNIVGKVKNTGNQDLTFIYVTFPIYSSEGVLQTVVSACVDVKAGEECSFEQMALFADHDIDYSASYLGDPVIHPLF